MTTTPIVALDVSTIDDAMRIVDRLGTRCRFYKIGSELFTAVGPTVVMRVRDSGCEVFLDLKLHDIPNTVRGAARSAAVMGVRLLTVHGAGGQPMIEAAVEGGGDRVGILVVTILTSFDEASLASATGRPNIDVSAEVSRLARVAASANAHGVVCAGSEAAAVRESFPHLAVLVPGIRMSGGVAHDQRRVVTPAEAAAAGARYIVVGRAVTAASDPAAAMDAVLSDLGSANPALRATAAY